MANLNSLFSKFNSEITLTANKRESLKRSRNALRKDIKDWFSDNEKYQPSFHGQGSYSMKTLINPINGKDYDIDDGIYIKGYENKDIEEWPTCGTVHSWIKKAVDDFKPDIIHAHDNKATVFASFFYKKCKIY